ncbi:phosphotransferase [Georgenia deserti]|uniref:Phosphotransferase n=1 Tax=Georgenia deserti TaxID=2093781 RepID=A0ABW4LAA1_9MICO
MTGPVGPLIASGRDAEIFELGDGLVLRRARDGRSLAEEAAVMAAARAGGVPVPAVHEVTDDGAVVLDKVTGPTLQTELLRRSWRTRAAAGVLHELHETVHRVASPAGLAPSGIPGTTLLHLDLHPMNVLMSPDGPVLIDWANARSGPPEADLANTWVILATSTVDAPWWMRAAVSTLRNRLVADYVADLDQAAVSALLPELVARRAGDRYVSDHERRRLEAWLRRTASRRRRRL